MKKQSFDYTDCCLQIFLCHVHPRIDELNSITKKSNIMNEGAHHIRTETY